MALSGGKGGVKRSVVTYKIAGKEVSPQTFAQQTGAPLTTSSGSPTALGRDVGVELPKGAKVEIIGTKPSGEEYIERTYYGTAERRPEPRVEIIDERTGKVKKVYRGEEVREYDRRMAERETPSYTTRKATRVEETTAAASILQQLAGGVGETREGLPKVTKPETKTFYKITTPSGEIETKRLTQTEAAELASKGSTIKTFQGGLVTFTGIEYPEYDIPLGTVYIPKGKEKIKIETEKVPEVKGKYSGVFGEVLGRATIGYEKSESFLSRQVQRVVPEITEERKGFLSKALRYISPTAPLFTIYEPKEVRKLREQQSYFEAGLFAGAVEELRTKPQKFLLTTAAFGVGGRALTGVKLIPKFGTIFAKVEKPVAYGLTGAWGIDIGREIYKTPTEAGVIVGKRFAGEFLPAIGGIYGGSKLFPYIERKTLGYTLEQRLVEKYYIESLSPEQAAKFKAAIKGYRESTGLEPPIKNIEMTRRIPPEARAGVKKVISEEKAVVFGSTVQKGVRAKDLDLFANEPRKVINRMAEEMRKVGLKPQVRGDKLYLEGRKVVEAHTPEEFGEFLYREKPVKTPEGILRITEQEQLARKVYGATTAGRKKDIPDLMELLKKRAKQAEIFGKLRKEEKIKESILGFKYGLGYKPPTERLVNPLKAFRILAKRGLVTGEEVTKRELGEGMIGKINLGIFPETPISIRKEMGFPAKKITLRHELRHLQFPFATEQEVLFMETIPFTRAEISGMERVTIPKLKLLEFATKIPLATEFLSMTRLKKVEITPKEYKPIVSKKVKIPKVKEEYPKIETYKYKKPTLKIVPYGETYPYKEVPKVGYKAAPTYKPSPIVEYPIYPYKEVPKIKYPTYPTYPTYPKITTTKYTTYTPYETYPTYIPPKKVIFPLKYKRKAEERKRKYEDWLTQYFRYTPTVIGVETGRFIKKLPFAMKKWYPEKVRLPVKPKEEIRVSFLEEMRKKKKVSRKKK